MRGSFLDAVMAIMSDTAKLISLWRAGVNGGMPLQAAIVQFDEFCLQTSVVGPTRTEGPASIIDSSLGISGPAVAVDFST